VLFGICEGWLNESKKFENGAHCCSSRNVRTVRDNTDLRVRDLNGSSSRSEMADRPECKNIIYKYSTKVYKFIATLLW
jgi:hypothetical protein